MCILLLGRWIFLCKEGDNNYSFSVAILVKTQSYRYSTEYLVALLEKPHKHPLEVFCKRRCSVKEGVLKNFACNFLKKTPAQVFSCKTWQIFKNIYFQEHLRTTVSTGHYRKSYSSISFTKLGLHNYYYNL